MANFKDDLALFLTHDEIQNLVTDLARKIEADYQDKEILWICPLRGSMHFISDIMRKVRLPQQLDFVQMETLSKGGTVRFTRDVSTNLTDKNIIIAEEIIDSGRALYYLVNHLELARPASIKIVTLLDKPARRELPIRADYIGKVIEDRYVVGYGMDSEEQGRHYKDIYYLKN